MFSSVAQSGVKGLPSNNYSYVAMLTSKHCSHFFLYCFWALFSLNTAVFYSKTSHSPFQQQINVYLILCVIMYKQDINTVLILTIHPPCQGLIYMGEGASLYASLNSRAMPAAGEGTHTWQRERTWPSRDKRLTSPPIKILLLWNPGGHVKI
jgi:hypothetical protein